MKDLDIKIALDYKNTRRHLICLDTHNLFIEVLNPRHEIRLNMATEVKTDELVFAGLVKDAADKYFRIYFRVLHESNQKPEHPWTYELFVDMADYYLKTKWKIEHYGFNLVNPENMYPYMGNEEVVF